MDGHNKDCITANAGMRPHTPSRTDHIKPCKIAGGARTPKTLDIANPVSRSRSRSRSRGTLPCCKRDNRYADHPVSSPRKYMISLSFSTAVGAAQSITAHGPITLNSGSTATQIRLGARCFTVTSLKFTD